MSPQELRVLRDDTPGCRERIHLNNAGAGLMPIPVFEAIGKHLSLERDLGGYEAAARQRASIDGAYAKLAGLLGSEPRNIAFTDSATSSFARALSAIPFREGDVLLTSTNDYVSNQIMFISLARRFGVRVVRVADTASGEIDLERLERHARDDRPRLIAVTHVPTNSGLVQPIEAIGRIAAEQETTYLVDACQSVGQLPVYVRKIRCDFLCGTSRKFLRGPRGFGFLYVGDRVLDNGLTPLFPDMRGATWTAADDFETGPTARRFEYWEQPFSLLLGTGAAVEYAMRVGLDRIAQRATALATGLREQLSERGFRLLDRGSKHAAIVTVAIPGHEPERFHRELERHRINTTISLREYATIDFDDKGVDWALRMSPHYYNSEAEIEEAVDVVSRLAGSAS